MTTTGRNKSILYNTQTSYWKSREELCLFLSGLAH